MWDYTSTCEYDADSTFNNETNQVFRVELDWNAINSVLDGADIHIPLQKQLLKSS